VDVVAQVDLFSLTKKCQLFRVPRQFLRIDQKHIHYIHLNPPVDREGASRSRHQTPRPAAVVSVG